MNYYLIELFCVLAQIPIKNYTGLLEDLFVIFKTQLFTILLFGKVYFFDKKSLLETIYLIFIPEDQEVIIYAGDAKHISDIIGLESESFDNCLVNKQKTGCGITSYELKQNHKLVIAKPFKQLIENKLHWCEDKANWTNDEGFKICAVYDGRMSVEDIINFQGDKILVTYDSIDKVVEALEQRDDIKEWRIFIDEDHLLVKDGNFRHIAMNKVLHYFSRFRAFTFATATPVDMCHQYPQLKDVKRVTIQWKEKDEVTVFFCAYDGDIVPVIAKLAHDHINSVQEDNLHFFFNSVEDQIRICSGLEAMKIDIEEHVRIVCSDKEENEKLIKKHLKGIRKISKAHESAKKINFYTSTAFVGSDIEDKLGKTIIVVNGCKDHTKINLSSDLPQIRGRIRNSIYKDNITLLYSIDMTQDDQSEEDSAKSFKDNLKKAEKTIELIEANKDEILYQELIEFLMGLKLITEIDGNMKVNYAYFHSLMYQLETIKKTYNLIDGELTEGTIESNGTIYRYINIDKESLPPSFRKYFGFKKGKMKEKIQEYIELMSLKSNFGIDPRISDYDETDPWIGEAYKIIGPDRMKTLKYSKTKILEETNIQNRLKSKRDKIISLLGFKDGDWISWDDIKKKLEKVYKKLGIDKNATATQIKEWYEIKKEKIKGVWGFRIEFCRYIQE